MSDVKFVMDNNVGRLNAEGFPEPSCLPEDVERILQDGNVESLPEFLFLGNRGDVVRTDSVGSVVATETNRQTTDSQTTDRLTADQTSSNQTKETDLLNSPRKLTADERLQLDEIQHKYRSELPTVTRVVDEHSDVQATFQASNNRDVPAFVDPSKLARGQFESPYPTHDRTEDVPVAEHADVDYSNPVSLPTGSPTIDDTVQAPLIQPDAAAYADLAQPGSLVDSQYSKTVSVEPIEELRSRIGVNKFVSETLRCISNSPCRTCVHGMEIFGIPEVRSQTWSVLGRRQFCHELNSDVTPTSIVFCSQYKEDPNKKDIPSIRQLQKTIRQKFKLTGPPSTPWDDQIEAEEAAISENFKDNKAVW